MWYLCRWTALSVGKALIRRLTMHVETLGSYYGNETPYEEELIWGKYTDEEWEKMTCEEQAIASFEYRDSLKREKMVEQDMFVDER
jgi:hypothetical protein